MRQGILTATAGVTPATTVRYPAPERLDASSRTARVVDRTGTVRRRALPSTAVVDGRLLLQVAGRVVGRGRSR